MNCDKDAMCQKMGEEALKFTSQNENPCVQEGTGDIVCTLKNSEGQDLSQELTIDALTFDLYGLAYSQDQDDENCVFKNNFETSKATDYAGNFYADGRLQVELTSPSGTLSVVKPLYTNWLHPYYVGKAGTEDQSLELTSATFYLEKVAPGADEFTLRIRSKCKVDLDVLNKFTDLTVYGRY